MNQGLFVYVPLRSIVSEQTSWNNCDLTTQGIPIYHLMCSVLRDEKDYQAILNNQTKCTQLGSQIARSLIRIAATRIFAEPEQSVLEIPVNSIDSYHKKNGQPSVGKFGLGFFSILYWLVGHPMRSITITSTYQRNNGQNCTWSSTIREIKQELYFNLQILKPTRSTGTVIKLNFEFDPLSNEISDNFVSQLAKLEDVKSVKIDSSFLNNQSQSSDLIKIGRNDTTAVGKFTDYALGISLSVYLNSMLLPSISTKTIKTATTQIDVDYRSNIEGVSERPYTYKKIKDRHSRNYFIRSDPRKGGNILYVLVGEIRVLIYKFSDLYDDYHESKFEKDPMNVELTTYFKDVRIVFPANARLPVSRDDVLIESPDEQILLRNILRRIIVDNIDHIDVVLDAYNAYSINTVQTTVQRIIRETEKWAFEYLQGKGYILVPPERYDQYKKLEKEWSFKQKRFIASQNYEIVKIEEFLLSNYKSRFDNKIYYGKYIASLALYGQADSLGLLQILFVDPTYQKEKDWINNLALSYSNDVLLPTKQEFGIEKYDNYSVLVNYLSNRDLINLAINVLNRIDKSNDYIKYAFDPLISFDRSLEVFFHRYDANLTEQYLSRYYTFLNLLRPESVAYGQSKRRFYTETSALIYDLISSRSNFNTGIVLFFHNGMNYDLVMTIVRNQLEQEVKDSVSQSEYDKIKRFNIDTIWYKLSSNYNDRPIRYNYQLASPFEPYLLLCYIFLSQPQHFDYLRSIDTKGSNRLRPILNNPRMQNAAKYLFVLLLQSESVFEYAVMVPVIMVNYDRINGIDADKSKIISFLLNRSRQRFTYRDLLDSYHYLVNKPDKKYFVIYFYYMTIGVDILSNNNLHSLHKVAQVKTLTQGYSFTAQQLLSYVNHRPLIAKNLYTDLDKIASWPGKEERLQAIEIAVNEGISKPFIEAVLTETIQNSLDAIRLSNLASNRFVDIVTRRVDTAESEYKLSLTIIDYVGIPPKGLLSLMIPFLSTKSASDIATGEMGSGFFNVYRQSEQVDVLTIYNQQRVHLQARPIRDTTGRVVDLNYHINQTIKEGNNGTKIVLTIPVANGENYAQILLNISYTTQYILSLISMSNVQMRLNGTVISRPLKTIYETEHFSASTLTDITTETSFQSYILTKGVPFANLYDYFVDKDLFTPDALISIRDNLVINIKSGVYTPVQSRTKINISNDKIKELQDFVSEAAYFLYIDQVLQLINTNESRKKIDEYIPNTSSTASVDQLIPKVPLYGLLISFAKNVSQKFEVAVYLGRHVNKDIKTGLNKTKHKSLNTLLLNAIKLAMREKNLQKVYKKLIKEVDPRLVKIIIFWLSNKELESTQIKIIPTTLDEAKKLEEERNEILQSINELISFTQLFVNIYWEIGAQLVNDGKLQGPDFDQTKGPPKIGYDPYLLVGGVYYPSTHSIDIHYSHETKLTVISELLNLLNNLSVNNIMYLQRKNEVFREYFITSMPTGVILHELEHAWRSSSHDGPHTDIELVINNQRKIYSFDAAANSVTDFIVSQGLYQRLIDRK